MGTVIIILGSIGILIALIRMVDLAMVGSKVASQAKNPTADTGNPLGRILKVYQDNQSVDVETLELKLGEAILGETPKINRGIAIVQVISVVSPLLGLLGTVIGMILTFQAITLFGTGDPKTMAGGISTALMTTVLGLCAAIPTVLMHAVVNGRAKSVIHVLEEQSAGIIAKHAEQSGKSWVKPMFNEAYYAIITFMERGGPVLPLIATLTFAMWTMIFERFWFFRTEFKTIVDSTIQEWEGREERRSWSAHAIREAMISQASEKSEAPSAHPNLCGARAAPGFDGNGDRHGGGVRRHGYAGR